MIEVYNDCKDEETTLPQPKLKLNIDGKTIYIEGVDKTGTKMSIIWSVSGSGMTCFHTSAKNAIEGNNTPHSTDWANWDVNGRFISLKEGTYE